MKCGAISDSANSRTLRRSCCCSSVKEKSTSPQVNCVSNNAQFLYTIGMERDFSCSLEVVPKTHHEAYLQNAREFGEPVFVAPACCPRVWASWRRSKSPAGRRRHNKSSTFTCACRMI